MNKIVKINSNQGGSFTATNNLCDFTIPDGVYNLSKSYVNLMCSISETPTTPALNGVYCPNVLMTQDDGTANPNRMSNIALVKNMNLKCQNRGVISDIRRVDVLRNNLNEYMYSTSEREGLGLSSLVQGFDRAQQQYSIFRDLRKEGTDKSEKVSSPVRIPLSQLCNFGKVQQYDVGKYGLTKLHLELNLDKISVGQYLGNVNGTNWSRATAERNAFKDLGVAVSGGDMTVLLSKNNFSCLEDSPFWVGQVLRVSAIAGGGRGGGNIVNKAVRITGIEFRRQNPTGATQGQIELTINEPISGAGVLTGGESYGTITCDGDDCDFTFNCDYGELVLEKVMTPQKSQDKIQYTEFTTEEHNANGVQNFQRQFQVEPECINLFVMKNEDIISKRGNLLNWRWRMNNEDLTDRPIVYGSPLSYDRLNMTLGNSGNKLHNSNEQNQAVKEDSVGTQIQASYNVAGNGLVLMCNPLPQTPNEKMIQININLGGATLNKMCLFKECVKVI